MESGLIVKRVVVGAWRANCYLVGSENGRQGMVIDPGDEAHTILTAIKDSGLEIKLLIATHGHIDHIGAIGRLKKSLGEIPVAIHKSDSTALQGDGRFFWGQSYGPALYPDKILMDGDCIEIAGLHFKIINTPGHTYGGICLYGHGILFTGDTLFRHSIGSSGIGTGSRHELLDSIKMRLMTLPPETIVYPGHGHPTTIGEEKQNNPYIYR